MKLVTLANAKTTTGFGELEFATGTAQISNRTVQVTGKTTSGSGSAVVDIEVSNDGLAWIVVGTVTVALGTTYNTDGFVFNAPWGKVRANIKTLIGTGAEVTVTLGV